MTIPPHNTTEEGLTVEERTIDGCSYETVFLANIDHMENAFIQARVDIRAFIDLAMDEQEASQFLWSTDSLGQLFYAYRIKTDSGWDGWLVLDKRFSSFYTERGMPMAREIGKRLHRFARHHTREGGRGSVPCVEERLSDSYLAPIGWFFVDRASFSMIAWKSVMGSLDDISTQDTLMKFTVSTADGSPRIVRMIDIQLKNLPRPVLREHFLSHLELGMDDGDYYGEDLRYDPYTPHTTEQGA